VALGFNVELALGDEVGLIDGAKDGLALVVGATVEGFNVGASVNGLFSQAQYP
jgi:hypothetical protein